MRNATFINVAQTSFSYLISDFGFKDIETQQQDLVASVVYRRGGFWVNLTYYWFDERFMFFLNDGSKVIDFMDLFLRNEPLLDEHAFKPTIDDFESGLQRHARYLKIYGAEILTTLKVR